MPKFMFGSVIHQMTKNMPSIRNLPGKVRHASRARFYKTVFKCFEWIFPSENHIINKLEQNLLPVSTTDRNLDFYYF